MSTRRLASAIAAQILSEVRAAAKPEGVSFNEGQIEFIEQALEDAALEAIHRMRLARELELKHVADAMKTVLPPATFDALHARVRNYLGNGGLFNPELMDGDKVRALILDLAAALSSNGTPPSDAVPE